MNDVKMKERPGFNIWADITFDLLDGFEHIITLKLLALIEPRMFVPAIQKLLTNYLGRLYSRLR